jgi:hypothetical protein
MHLTKLHLLGDSFGTIFLVPSQSKQGNMKIHTQFCFSFKLSMIEKLWTKTIQLSLETQKEKTQLTKVVTRGNDSATLKKPSSTFKGFF